MANSRHQVATAGCCEEQRELCRRGYISGTGLEVAAMEIHDVCEAR